MKELLKKLRGIVSILLVLFLAFTLVACDEEQKYEPYEGTVQTDTCKLTKDYEGKSFVNQSIGRVTLRKNVDGDTAHFVDDVSGEWFTARFLCVNTPESTIRIDPWGKEASKWVGGILSSATEIVLESKTIGEPAEKDTTNKRYLAYVWYKSSEIADFRMLNLEIIEKGYSRFTDDYTKVADYGEYFKKANDNSYALKIKEFGELDPNYDYSGEVKEVTPTEIKKNFEQYEFGTYLKVIAKVVRLSGDNLYVQDVNYISDDETGESSIASIYLYAGNGSSLARYLQPGDVIEFECQVVNNETYGKQLTNPSGVKKLTGYDPSCDIINITSDDLPNGPESLKAYEGHVVCLDYVRVTGKKLSTTGNGAFTIYCVTKAGKQVNIRVDGKVNPKYDYDSVVIGGEYRIIAGVSKYSPEEDGPEEYQFMLGNQRTELEKKDFMLLSELND